MVYEFTKADEGKYFLETIILDKTLIYKYYYIIRIIDKVIVYRNCNLIKAMYSAIRLCLDAGEALESIRILKWNFAIATMDNFVNDLVEHYPLDLVVLGLFRPPSKYLTKRQKQQIRDFEN